MIRTYFSTLRSISAYAFEQHHAKERWSSALKRSLFVRESPQNWYSSSPMSNIDSKKSEKSLTLPPENRASPSNYTSGSRYRRKTWPAPPPNRQTCRQYSGLLLCTFLPLRVHRMPMFHYTHHTFYVSPELSTSLASLISWNLSFCTKSIRDSNQLIFPEPFTKSLFDNPEALSTPRIL